MQLIGLQDTAFPPRFSEEAAQEALAGVIGTLGTQDFGPRALALLNRWMPLCWWSIYQLFDDAPPRLHALGSCGVPDGTLQSWQAYRGSLYRRDETFAAARDALQTERGVMLHWHAREIPSPHREQIYSRHGLRERLSLVASDTQRGLMAVNFYRHDEQSGFSDADMEAMRRMARPLLACVAQHLRLGESAELERSALQMLTGREREVCERMLKGWTHEGIAADLGISAATVKTYRDRAFERLGIHHRNELFALAAGCLDHGLPRQAPETG